MQMVLLEVEPDKQVMEARRRETERRRQYYATKRKAERRRAEAQKAEEERKEKAQKAKRKRWRFRVVGNRTLCRPCYRRHLNSLPVTQRVGNDGMTRLHQEYPTVIEEIFGDGQCCECDLTWHDDTSFYPSRPDW